jgi:hypothetical protein
VANPPKEELVLMRTAFHDIPLFWVEPDPDRERATDPLGLGAQADQIAGRLLPGMSVNTSRARYLSFFCWAVSKARDSAASIASIHRLEAELACEESLCHWDDSTECPDVVGAGRARAYLKEHNRCFPSRPEGLYKNMAFAAYRPMMRSLGLLAEARRPTLTREGEQLADLHRRARGPKPRCLGELKGPELTRLRVLLGLDFRAAEPRQGRARAIRAAYAELERPLGAGLASSTILEHHAARPRSTKGPGWLLHQAYAWEALSLGLVLGFAILLNERSLAAARQQFHRAFDAPAQWPGLRACDPADAAAPRWVRGLLRRAVALDPASLGLDAGPVYLARRLTHERDVNGFLTGLLERHTRAKLGDAWVRLHKGSLRVLAPKKNLNLVPEPRTYRIDAFGQMLRDLRLV